MACNTNVVASNSEIFPDEKTSLDGGAIQNNISKIREVIANNQGINIKNVDLSKSFFARSTLSTKGHKEEAEHQFQDFLLKQDPDLQVSNCKIYLQTSI